MPRAGEIADRVQGMLGSADRDTDTTELGYIGNTDLEIGAVTGARPQSKPQSDGDFRKGIVKTKNR